MKINLPKRPLLFIFLVFSLFRGFADSFTDILQDLAIQTACIGQYSMTQAGGGWYDDPQDYYTPQMMAERFRQMSGNMTRTTTFYGVCFDYAEAAYWDIKTYEGTYESAGMCAGQFWLAEVGSNPNLITLGNPTTYSNATKIQNGVPVRTYGSASNRNVKTHKKLDGTRATRHAWLWVERADGVWFWIDPTWTDNLGYVVWGYVANGEEIQLRPDEKYCQVYPAYLRNLPTAPAMGKRIEQKNPSTASSDSYAEETDVESNYDNYPALFIVSISASVFSFNYNSLETDKMGIALDFLSLVDELFGGFSLEGLWNFDNEKSILAGICSLSLGYRFFNHITPYACGGIGWGVDNKKELKNSTAENYEKPDAENFLAYKVGGGFAINLASLVTKFEVSYNNVFGLSVGIGFGY